MKSKYLSRLGLVISLLTLALCFICPTTIKAQSFNLVSSDININSNGFVDDQGCPGPKVGNCNFVNANLQSGVYGNQFANDCGYSRVKNQPNQCYTTCDANYFYSLNGAGTDEVSIDWLNFESVFHDIELGSAYIANTNSNSSMDVILDLAGVAPGTKVKIYYTYEIFAAAVGASEVGEPDLATVLPNLSLFNSDLIQQGGFNLAINAGPTNGAIRRAVLSGFFFLIVGQPIPVSIVSNLATGIVDPGIPHQHIQQGMHWHDFATAEFGGNLTISTNPLPQPPTSPAQPAASHFSVDIGSASELSDPGANGTEYFDPGDAYLFYAPSFPPGGADGDIDDEDFLGIDVFPSAPDGLVPSFSAAPVGTGTSLSDVQTAFFDMDGLDKLSFDFDAGGGITPVNPDECLFRIERLLISLDDDLPENYLSVIPNFGAPANSASYSSGTEYGSLGSDDEIIERSYALVPFFPKTTVPTSSEQVIHPNLFPDPVPGNSSEDDDIDALDLVSEAGTCDVVYFSADHEAVGSDINGNVLDPGVVYRKVGSGLTSAVLPSDLGLPSGVDINAFEFAILPDDPLTPFGPGSLALVFSTDADDPETVGQDESGGLDPTMIYWSYMDGFHQVLDSVTYLENVDAISILDQSLLSINAPNTCNPFNFTNVPTALTASVSPTEVVFEWDQYPFSTACQLSGNKVSNPNDAKVLVQSSPGNTPPFNRAISLSSFQPGTAYRVKVRCGCQFQGTQYASPYTPYVFFTIPGPTPPPGSDGVDIFSESDRLFVYPNPAVGQVNVNFPKNVGVLRIRDVVGREVWSGVIGEQPFMGSREIDVSGFKPGVYLVEAQNGGETLTTKFVVE